MKKIVIILSVILLNWNVGITQESENTELDPANREVETYGRMARETTAVPVLSVTVTPSHIILEKGKTESLTVTVFPDNATDKRVRWYSKKSAVAKVDNEGNVTAVRTGETVITVKTVDGNKAAYCIVKVTVSKNSESREVNPPTENPQVQTDPKNLAVPEKTSDKEKDNLNTIIKDLKANNANLQMDNTRLRTDLKSAPNKFVFYFLAVIAFIMFVLFLVSLLSFDKKLKEKRKEIFHLKIKNKELTEKEEYKSKYFESEQNLLNEQSRFSSEKETWEKEKRALQEKITRLQRQSNHNFEGRKSGGLFARVFLYADSIYNNAFNRVTEKPNDDTIFELLKNPDGRTAKYIIWENAYTKVLKRPEFVDGCDTQKIGSRSLEVEHGTVQFEDGKWKITQKAKVKFV